MNFTTFVAKRYFQSGSKNHFFSWIATLTIAGVAIGVAAMIVVWSVINGFETELRNRFLSANAHIMAYRFPNGMTHYQDLIEDFKEKYGQEISGISPFVHYESMARKGSQMHSVLIRGIDPIARQNVQNLARIVTPDTALPALSEEMRSKLQGEKDLPAIILGISLASLLDAKVGDVIEMVEPNNADFGTLKKFKVVGFYDSGLKHYDDRLAILSLPTAQRFFKMGNRVIGLEIGLHDPWKSTAIATEMESAFGLSVREWQSYNKPFFEAMKTERVVILLITALVAGVAAFNILTTIFVSVSQKQRDISILKALGASNKQIVRIFLKKSAYIGCLGSLIGVLLAYGICAILERYEFIDLPDLYLLARLPMSYEWEIYLFVALSCLLIAILAGAFPSWLASKVNPVEGFRGNEGLD